MVLRLKDFASRNTGSEDCTPSTAFSELKENVFEKIIQHIDYQVAYIVLHHRYIIKCVSRLVGTSVKTYVHLSNTSTGVRVIRNTGLE